MISKDDLRRLSLQFEFPVEKEEFLVEKIYKNISLNVLKFKETESLNIFIRVLNMVPLIESSDIERGIRLNITRNSMNLRLGIMRGPIIEEEEEASIIAKLFSDESLNGISNDMNFLIGRASSLFEKEELEVKASGALLLERKVKPDFSLEKNFSEDLIDSMKEVGEVNFSGLTLELKNKSKISKINCETSEEKIRISVDFIFSNNKPINIITLLKEIIEELKLICQKLRVE